MSELKSYKMVDEDYCDNAFCVIPSDVYLKSEADEVIAELKNEIEEQKRLRNMALASVPNVLKVMKIIQHHKYKRCLSNAWWCLREEFYAEDCHCERWVNWAIRWYKRWLELANKFKEAKCR